MTHPGIQKLRELLREATALPWKLRCAPHGYDLHPDQDRDFLQIIARLDTDTSNDSEHVQQVNLVLIKEAVNALPALLDRLDALEKSRFNYESLLRFVTRYVWSKPDLTPQEALDVIAYCPDVIDLRDQWQRIAEASNDQHTLSKLRPRAIPQYKGAGER